MTDAELFEVWNDRRGRVEVKIGGKLKAIGSDRDGGGHQRAARDPSTDQGRLLSDASLPQSWGAGLGATRWTREAAERLAMSCSVVPSPMCQLAVSRPLSAAWASPKAAPEILGTISLWRIASRCCTSASLFFPFSSLADCQSSFAD